MQEQNEIKARYEERIRELEKKLKKYETPEPDEPEEFLKDSLCPHNDQERKYLKSLLGNK
jgi:hypothetical protein